MKYDGMKLRDEIARRKLSVPEFAQTAGLTPFTVYRAMTSGRANTRTLGKIAEALNVDRPTELLQKPPAQM